jgi:small-conductance mechanosensitive channel
VLNGNTAQNDIRFAVLDAFDSEGIDIPSTPRAEVRKPAERWPTDDEKDEAGLIEQKAREEAALAEQKAAKGRRRPRKPDPD